MSEPSVQGQESKAVPCCHDRPPQYDSSQPSQDLLTSIIENEYTGRNLIQRIDELDKEVANLFEEHMKNLKNKNPMETPDYNRSAEFFQKMGQKCAEMTQVCTGMENIFKERVAGNTYLYTAMSKLTDYEFKRTYDSLKRDSNREMRNEKLSQGLPSETANISKMADDATAKSPVSFWKRIFRHSARP